MATTAASLFHPRTGDRKRPLYRMERWMAAYDSFPVTGPASLAGRELLDGSGLPDPASLDPGHRAAQPRSANKLGSPVPGLSAARQEPHCPELDSRYTPRLLKSSEAVNRWFSTGLCDAAQFSTSKVKTP